MPTPITSNFKQLKTRISLKTDTLANWEASDLQLLAGEVGFATNFDYFRPITSKGPNQGGDYTSEEGSGSGSGVTPYWLPNFKIGDGTRSWTELPYAIPEFSSEFSSIIGDYTTGSGSTRSRTKIVSISHIDATKIWTVDNGVTLNYFTWGGQVNEALASLDAAIYNTAASSGVISIGGASGVILLGNGLSANGQTIDIDTSGYVTNDSTNGIHLDTASIDSNYTIASGDNIATVSTVSTALASLDSDNKYVVISGTPSIPGTNEINFYRIKQKDGLMYSTWGQTDATIDLTLNFDPFHNYNGTTNPIATIGTVESMIGSSTLSVINVSSASPYINLASSSVENNQQTISASLTIQSINGATDASHMGLVEASDAKTYIDTAINNALDSEVTFKGVTSSEPVSPTNGDMWKAGGNITLSSAASGQPTDVHAGDTIIYKNISGATDNGWYVIRHDTDTDTWRDIYVHGAEFLGSGTSTGSVNFTSFQDNPVEVSGSQNTIIISHTSYTIPTPTTTSRSEGDEVTLVSGITGDGYGHIASYTTDTFIIPTVNNASFSIYGGSTLAETFTANAASDVSVSIVSDNAAINVGVSRGGISIGHSTTTSNAAAAVKVGNDEFGHVVLGATLAATDISATPGSYGGTTTVTNVQGALDNLTTAVGNVDEPGALFTSSSAQSKLPSTGTGASMGSDVTLHDIARTGDTDDLLQSHILWLNCGTATTVIDTI